MDVEGAFSLDLGATTMTTAGVHSTLNITGDSTLTLEGWIPTFVQLMLLE